MAVPAIPPLNDRVSFCPDQRTQLLILMRDKGSAGQRKLWKLRADSWRLEQSAPFAESLRLTGAGDHVELEVSTSANGVEILTNFRNETLESVLRFVEK